MPIAQNIVSALQQATPPGFSADDLVKKYPYFQTAHILVAKQTKTNQDFEWENHARQAALFALDRSKLYELLVHEPKEIEGPSEIEPEKKEANQDFPAAQSAISDMPSAEYKEIKTVVPEATFEPPIAQAIPVPTQIPSISVQEKSSLIEELERNMATLKALKRESHLESFLEKTEEIPRTESVVYETKTEIPVLIEREELPSVETTPKQIPVSNAKKYITPNPFASNTFKNPSYSSSNDVWDSRLGDIISNAEIETLEGYFFYLKRRKNPLLQEQMEVITSFIQKNPSISKPLELSTAENKTDFSQKSTKESEGLVTENLANIFIKQKKFSKAKEIYQKLMLKFPEKSTYFAQKISELQNL